MATLKKRKAFFSQKEKEPYVMRLNGKSLKLANVPGDMRKKILDRLAEKYEVLAQGRSGVLPGIKIDGKVVTKDNIHEFELKPAKKEEPKRDSSKIVEEQVIEEAKKEEEYTKEYLEGLEFSEIREIGYKVGAKGRSKKGLIKDILDIQTGKKEKEIEEED